MSRPLAAASNNDRRLYSYWFAALLILSGVYLALGWLRSANGLIHAFDTGIYLQILSSLHLGHGWASSITGESNFLAHHFQPIVSILLPFYSTHASALLLLGVGWASSGLAALFLAFYLPRRGICSWSSAAAVALALFVHPTIASRMFYSFVPEIIALPFLLYQASLLAQHRAIRGRQVLGLLFSILVIGGCKENFWLINSWVALLLVIKERRSRWVWSLGALSLASAAAFCWIFWRWMPAHSALKQYYGLSYYANSWVDGRWGLGGQVLGAALNMLQMQSLETFLLSVLVIPAGLSLWAGYWALAGAVPGLVFIVASSDAQIHNVCNHYLLAALPFISVACAQGLDKMRSWTQGRRKIYFYQLLLSIAIPLGLTLMHPSGFIYQVLFASERVEPRLLAAAQELRRNIHPDDRVLIDGSLQPLFHDLPHVQIILGFQGNPTRLTQEDLARAQHVITANDLSTVQNCSDLQQGSGDLLRFDYKEFYRYCNWLKQTEFESTVFIPGRLVHMKVKSQLKSQ